MRTILFVVSILFGIVLSAYADPLLIDDFEGSDVRNKLDCKANVFIQPPSKIMMTFKSDTREEKSTQVLLLKYRKELEGGPYDVGGWCGYYTLMKKANSMGKEAWFDASKYKSLTFWVRGQTDKENLVVGFADRHWDNVGDSVKTDKDIGFYLPSGKLSTEWQKATIPLESIWIDWEQLASIAIVFEGYLFNSPAEGTVFVDDIQLEETISPSHAEGAPVEIS